MNIRDINLADKRLQLGWDHLAAEWPKLHPDDPKPFLSQVFRPGIMQEAYYAQGRKSLQEVNAIRAKAKLAPISAKENLRVVTHATVGKSKHERTPAEAFDIAFVKKGTKTELDYSEHLFVKAAAILKKFNPKIVWGGNWAGKKRDMPHFEV